MTSIDPARTVAELVLDHPRLATVFHRHRIDYCCRGDAPLAAAAGARGVDLAMLAEELEHALASPAGDGEVDPRELPTGALLEHIVGRYHEPLRRTLPGLVALARKVGGVHGAKDPRLVDLAAAVEELAAELHPHLDLEEERVFPLLRSPGAGELEMREALREMLAEHVPLARLLDRIREATDGLRVPPWACRSLARLYSELGTLEAELLRHVHLENTVLLSRFVR